MEQTNSLLNPPEPSVPPPVIFNKRPFILIGGLFLAVGVLAGLLLDQSLSRPPQPSASRAAALPSPTIAKPSVEPSTVIPSPTPTNPIANWETYKNTNLGLELRYPNDLIITECGVGRIIIDKEAVTPVPGNICQRPSGTTKLDVLEQKDPTNIIAIKNWLQNPLPYKRVSGETYTRVEKIVLGGKELFASVQFGEADMAGGYSTSISFVNDSGTVITISYSNEYNPGSDATISKKILSTFKFLDQTSQLSEKDEVAKFVDDYMKAYISGDENQIKSFLASKEEANYDIIRSYGIKKYEVLSIAGPNKLSQYFATVRCYKSDGTAMKNPEGDPRLMIVKENSAWKTLSWYFSQ